MSAIQSILVFGATGSQGGATITVQPISPPSCNRTDISIFQALAKLNSPIQKYKILAVTRNVASDKAKALASLPGIEVVLWDPSSSAALFEMNKVDGMFLVLDAFQADETGQGRELIDLAIKHGVQHVVYSGVDFCGQDSTPLPHFKTKRAIEKHIKASSVKYTILRPTIFMDNFYWPPFHDAVTNLFNDNNLYGMIAVADIGRAAADAFERPEAFAGKTIGLAGDLISLGDMKKVWKDVTGKGLGGGAPPELPKPFMDTMVFYGDVKPDADVEANRKMFPGVMDFKTWLSATPMAK